jgi:hypothetical protein
VRRAFRIPIATNVPGTFICEKMPLMARRMDKVAVIRSWQGKDGSHDTGSQHVTSGFPAPRGGQFFPNFGSLIAAIQGGREPGVPPHIGLPVAARYTNSPGYLGPAYDAYNIKGDPAARDAKTNGKMTLEPIRFEDRQSMLRQLENLGRLAELDGRSLEAHDKFAAEALAAAHQRPDGAGDESRRRAARVAGTLRLEHLRPTRAPGAAA